MRDIEEEKACGKCCWFYNEGTCGDGICAEAIGIAWHGIVRCDEECHFSRGGSDNPCFVSIKEMRHYQAVLAQSKRIYDSPDICRYMPPADEVKKAIKFAYKYISTMSKL